MKQSCPKGSCVIQSILESNFTADSLAKVRPWHEIKTWLLRDGTIFLTCLQLHPQNFCFFATLTQWFKLNTILAFSLIQSLSLSYEKKNNELFEIHFSRSKKKRKQYCNTSPMSEKATNIDLLLQVIFQHFYNQ